MKLREYFFFFFFWIEEDKNKTQYALFIEESHACCTAFPDPCSSSWDLVLNSWFMPALGSSPSSRHHWTLSTADRSSLCLFLSNQILSRIHSIDLSRECMSECLFFSLLCCSSFSCFPSPIGSSGLCRGSLSDFSQPTIRKLSYQICADKFFYFKVFGESLALCWAKLHRGCGSQLFSKVNCSFQACIVSSLSLIAIPSNSHWGFVK